MKNPANRITIHGVFVDVGGCGILIKGESGIGKSECALSLISRGHRLIADDAVVIERVDDRLFAESTAGLSGLIHIRDLGIIDARRAFGETSVGRRQEISLSIEFRKAGEAAEPGRVGPVEEFEILGVKIPKYVLTVGPSRPLAVLVETATKLQAAPDAVVDAESVLAKSYSRAASA